MRRMLFFVVGLFVPVCVSFESSANQPTCVVQVGGDPVGNVFHFHDMPDALLIGAGNGLFRYHGERTIRIDGEPTGEVLGLHDVSDGVLLNTANGLLLFDGQRTVGVLGESTGYVESVRSVPNGALVAAGNGLFRYENKRVVRIEGADTGNVRSFHATANGLLLGAENGLFRYDGERIDRIEGEPTGYIKGLYEASDGVLLGAVGGLFHYDGARISRVEGDETASDPEYFRDQLGGLLVGTWGGLFRYDGTRLAAVEGDPTGFVGSVHDTPRGLFLVAVNGFFRLDGMRTVRIKGETAGEINSVSDTADGLILGARNGLFRYDGERIVRIEGEVTGTVKDLLDTPGGLLVAADNGLFLYDGARIVGIRGEPTYSARSLHSASNGLLFAADRGPSSNESGLFRVVDEPLATSNVVLDNASELEGTAPSELGVPTRWTLTHPCSAFAAQFDLQVVATDARAVDITRQRAVGFQHQGEATSFEAWVPVPDAGAWTFRVTSPAAGSEVNIGQPTEAIAFVAPGVLGWLAAWWRVIAGSSAAILTALNIAVFAAARYSPAAWRLATEESWGNVALLPQRLMLRYWRGAQLWLLDQYVQQRRADLEGTSLPYLSLPLAGSRGEIVDGDAVLGKLAAARHIWVQGGAGMGKTAIFQHVCRTHFGGAENTSFSIFRRDGYILVPVEARRFPEAPFDEPGASGWLVACVLSVLSERRLMFEDRGLLRAMLSTGALAVAIDGMNEVARNQAALAFAAEFPATPLFVTSQESGEAPFQVWRLPSTIAAHVDGLLRLYLGPEKGEALGARLRDGGLIEHLRSGYDVRLLVDLAETESDGASLPRDRVELYRAAVDAAWPAGDGRLELLEAAAWKLVSERAPNEDKRRLRPDVDAPKDLLEQLEAVRERSGRSIRLIRGAPAAYEFVHDQMNAYLAACWFVTRPSVTVMCDLLEATTAWQEGLESQRILWGFVAAMLDRSRLEILWIFAGDDDRRAVLGRALAERAEREGWPLTRPPVTRSKTPGRRARTAAKR